MSDSGKITISTRIDPILWKKFSNLSYHRFGHGGIAVILAKLIKTYVDKFDDSIELNDPIRTAPNIMADLTTEIIPFLKSLDLEIISSKDNKNGMLQGPLEIALNNCRDASIYARALRVRRVLGTTSFETQRKTPMTFEEAHTMIKKENMEEFMNRRLYEIHFETLREPNAE